MSGSGIKPLFAYPPKAPPTHLLVDSSAQDIQDRAVEHAAKKGENRREARVGPRCILKIVHMCRDLLVRGRLRLLVLGRCDPLVSVRLDLLVLGRFDRLVRVRLDRLVGR